MKKEEKFGFDVMEIKCALIPIFILSGIKNKPNISGYALRQEIIDTVALYFRDGEKQKITFNNAHLYRLLSEFVGLKYIKTSEKTGGYQLCALGEEKLITWKNELTNFAQIIVEEKIL